MLVGAVHERSMDVPVWEFGTAAKLETADAGFFKVLVETAVPATFGGMSVSEAITVTVRLVSGVRPETSAEVAEDDRVCPATTLPAPLVTWTSISESATSLAGIDQATCIEVLVTCDTARLLTALNDRGVAPTATADPIVSELAATIIAIVRLAIRDRFLRGILISITNTPISYRDNMRSIRTISDAMSTFCIPYLNFRICP